MAPTNQVEDENDQDQKWEQMVEQEIDLKEGTDTENSQKEKDEETKKKKEHQVYLLVHFWAKP